MRAKQDNLHEPRRPITGLECEHYRGETDGERDTSFSEAARSIDLCRLKTRDNISLVSTQALHVYSNVYTVCIIKRDLHRVLQQ